MNMHVCMHLSLSLSASLCLSDVMACRSGSTKLATDLELFCGKRPAKIRHTTIFTVNTTYMYTEMYLNV